jgi:sugar lactone lactonase YvrE
MARATQLTDPITEHGEGPVWWPDAHLRLVDLFAGDLVDLYADGSTARTHVGAIAAVARPRAAGGTIVATERGIMLLDELDNTVSAPPPVWADAGVRMNDGGCDTQGRFYCGSMAYDESPGRGRLYRFDGPDEVTAVLESVTISNGIAFSPDGSSVFYADTPTGRVDRFDQDAGGALTGRRPFVELPDEAGYPDGIALDADGGLWVACWGAGAVRHFDGGGRLDEVIDVPAPQVTACTLGGPELTTLYVTTSRMGRDLDAAAPDGAVFEVRGVPAGLAALPCRF